MIQNVLLPELSHTFSAAEMAGDTRFYVTLDERVGTMFRLPVQDAESVMFWSNESPWEAYLGRLKPGVTVKFISRTNPSADMPWPSSRKTAIETFGWTREEMLLCVETTPKVSLPKRLLTLVSRSKGRTTFEPETQFLLQAADFAALRELGAEGVADDAIKGIFPNLLDEVVKTRSGLEIGTGHIGIARLWRQGTAFLAPDTLARLREQLPAPFEIVTNVRKVPDVRAQYLLQRKRGQESASRDSLAVRGLETTEDVLEQTLLAGKSLVEVEWLLILKRNAEAELKSDLAQAVRVLSPLGDLLIEVQGAAASFRATFPGSDPHYSFLELHDKATYYLPIAVRGEGPNQSDYGMVPPSRALPLHRRDGSLYLFDLWRPGYDGANCIINGRRGKGKSVLANLISSALLQDQNVRLVKVDVGGSYIKECDLYGGHHVQFNLSEPSGLNPFALLSLTQNVEDSAVILAGLLSSLILESGEKYLSKELQGAVEKAVLAYAEAKPVHPSLGHFLTFVESVPRRGLLERFGPQGVFANVLKETGQGQKLLDSRYVYYNFERLQNAANEDFAQAVMAAVIATVNLEVLRAGDARRGVKQRVVFFADETPFFIQRNGRFFKLTTANFRKFGHGTILIAQTTRDFELPKEDGTTDYGILINSPIRFLYQIDDDESAFCERFGLTSREAAEIKNLGRTEQYREVFLQDEIGSRVLRVAVTPEEYWRVTSTRADNEKLQSLLQAVPGLKLEEAIRCLSLG